VAPLTESGRSVKGATAFGVLLLDRFITDNFEMK